MRGMNKFIAQVCLLGLFTSLIFIHPAKTTAEAPASGASVQFDSSGKFTDPLDNVEHMFYQAGITQAGGGITGPGQVIYSAAEEQFKSITLDVTFGKWSLNYTDADDLMVIETQYDAATGLFTDGKQVPLVRELKAMTNKDVYTASYISGKISPGIHYLRVVLPRENYFDNPDKYGDFKVDGITFTSMAATVASLDYIIDNASDFSHVAGGTDTSPFIVKDLKNDNAIWDARTYASSYYIKRADATREDQGMIYEAPEGMDLKNVYVEGYFNFEPSGYFEVWASSDGVSYANATQSSNYQKPAILYNGDWLYTLLKINQLPAGTQFVQLRFPLFTQGELYGVQHPYITKVALGYGNPGGPIDPEDPTTTYLATTTIQKTSLPVGIDGIVEPDAPGEWQGANFADIAGTVDTNNDAHRAKVYVKYDYENLYVGAKIKDPTPMKNTNTGSGIWNGDNLEIFLGSEDLDYTRYPTQTNTMIPSDIQIVLSGNMDNGPQYYLNKDGEFTYPNIAMDVRQDADGKGYTIEAAIPLNVLGIANPWENRKIIMNAVLNDGDYASRGQWGWTTNGEGSKKSRGIWGLASFEPGPAPPSEISVNASVDSATNKVTVSGRTANQGDPKYIAPKNRITHGKINMIISCEVINLAAFLFLVIIDKIVKVLKLSMKMQRLVHFAKIMTVVTPACQS